MRYTFRIGLVLVVIGIVAAVVSVLPGSGLSGPIIWTGIGVFLLAVHGLY